MWKAAARVPTPTQTFEHITAVLKSLHWLPVEHRITFKILQMFPKALHGDVFSVYGYVYMSMIV